MFIVGRFSRGRKILFESAKVQITRVRITEIRIIDVYRWEVFKGPENSVRISKSSNYTSSNYRDSNHRRLSLGGFQGAGKFRSNQQKFKLHEFEFQRFES